METVILGNTHNAGGGGGGYEISGKNSRRCAVLKNKSDRVYGGASLTSAITIKEQSHANSSAHPTIPTRTARQPAPHKATPPALTGPPPPLVFASARIR